MSLRMQLWLIFLAPIALVAGLYAFGLTIPVPHLGREYVIRLLLPDAGAPVDARPLEPSSVALVASLAFGCR